MCFYAKANQLCHLKLATLADFPWQHLKLLIAWVSDVSSGTPNWRNVLRVQAHFVSVSAARGSELQVPVVISAGLPCICSWYKKGSGNNLKHEPASNLHSLMVAHRGFWAVAPAGFTQGPEHDWVHDLHQRRRSCTQLVESVWEPIPGCFARL